MLSDSSKSAFKMVSEDPQNNIAKKYKQHETFASLAISEALTINPTNFLRAPFNS